MSTSRRDERYARRRHARIIAQRLLKQGPTDQRVIEQDALIEQLEAAMRRGHSRKCDEIAKKLAANEKRIRAAEAEQRAAMEAALDRALGIRDAAKRAQKLVDAFEICALAQIVAQDDFGDDETADRAVAMKHKIVAFLDDSNEGRRALVRLLESPFAGVRASAGAHLLNANLLRARIVPLLQEIEEKVAGSAGWTAFWALSPDDHGPWLKGGSERTKP